PRRGRFCCLGGSARAPITAARVVVGMEAGTCGEAAAAGGCTRVGGTTGCCLRLEFLRRSNSVSPPPAAAGFALEARPSRSGLVRAGSIVGPIVGVGLPADGSSTQFAIERRARSSLALAWL